MDADEPGEVLDARDVKRAEVLDIARHELGAGRPELYWSDVLGADWKGPPPKHWCGAFCLWALHAAGLAKDVRWNVGLGFLEVYLSRSKVRPEDAKPGDICYFTRFQHHALFAKLDEDVTVLVTIDGNQGAPNRVRQQRRAVSSARAIYSIEKFLAADTLPAPAIEDDDDAQV